MDRRPIKTRSAGWAQGMSRGLVRIGLTPNLVSLIGIAFSAVAGGLLWCSPCREGGERALLLALAAGFIQLRLLCNMLDGLMAVECGLKSKTGDLFNEVPDRIEDIFILAGAGVAAGSPALGLVAATLAVLTAYVRALGGSLGIKQDFCGPMAKPHRMFVTTLGCLAAAGEVMFCSARYALRGALLIVVAGAVVTALRRLLRLARALEAR